MDPYDAFGIYQLSRYPIREMPKNDLSKALARAIARVAELYVGAANSPQEVFVEASSMIIREFSDLHHEEIVDAFRLASVGKIDVDIRAYYGRISLAMFGEVLSKYRKYRSKAIAEIQRSLDELEKEKRAEQIAQRNAEVRQSFIDEVKSSQYASWEYCPEKPERLVKIILEEYPLTQDLKSELWKKAREAAYKGADFQARNSELVADLANSNMRKMVWFEICKTANPSFQIQ